MRPIKSLLPLTLVALIFLAATATSGETTDELYKKALKEGGALNFYSALLQDNAIKILPAFEKRFPGVKVNHIHATADKLVARAVAEARGGKTLGDIFQGNLEYMAQMKEQGLLEEKVPPEAAAYPKSLKGAYWVATDLLFIVAAWNTNLVKKEDEPTQFEHFAHPKWKNRLIAEPRDQELLLALARHKYKDDEKAISLLKSIAANNVEFHKGHGQLTELVVMGQAAACITCYSHHYPPRIKKGAPVNYMLTEGIGSVTGTAVFKNAPHASTAWLFARWAASEEGQKAYAVGGRTPAHSKVEPAERTRPEKIYALNVDDLKDFPKYEKIWREIFKLR